MSIEERSLDRTRRILVVDDDPAIVRLVKDRLEYVGYDVVTAPSGQAALNAIAQIGLPHLAIVDINMPGMNGFEFCKTVQQFSDLPVILLTAVDEEETIIRGIQHFAEDYVTKPFSPRELVARVERNMGYAAANKITASRAGRSSRCITRVELSRPTEKPYGI